ncbi:MAG: DUF4416 family protein [Anaerolineae bacterium]|jgi:hypothetical protein|nr:DUF4416 family protein [Anaerolineae bacterium]
MMGTVKKPLPVKLIVSAFAGGEALLAEAKARLVAEFGPIDYESALLPFDHTPYYTPEFGPGLVRRIWAFEKLIEQGELAAIKRRTNDLEAEWAVGGRRRINLDPGFVAHSKMVLATTKDHAHRIYIGEGIYAEVTLYFRDGSFRAWPWTYPDYASLPYLEIFNQIRALYAAQMKK